MIPLSWFLIAWLILVAIFALLALFTIAINTRYGFASLGTYSATAIFLLVAVGVILTTGGYLMTVDWSQSLNVIPSSAPTLEL
ncbi:MAG: hypothetical protein WCV84_05830 [Patescibacteria group bacterium]